MSIAELLTVISFCITVYNFGYSRGCIIYSIILSLIHHMVNYPFSDFIITPLLLYSLLSTTLNILKVRIKRLILYFFGVFNPSALDEEVTKQGVGTPCFVTNESSTVTH